MTAAMLQAGLAAPGFAARAVIPSVDPLPVVAGCRPRALEVLGAGTVVLRDSTGAEDSWAVPAGYRIAVAVTHVLPGTTATGIKAIY